MADTHYVAASTGSGTSLVKVGGVLAIAGTMIGVAIFVMGCFGFAAVFGLSLIPLALGAVGLILTVCGGVFQKPIGVEDTHLLAALIINIGLICGALIEVAIWFNKPLFGPG